MSFALQYESFPPPAGPLRFAPIPWDSALYGFPVYKLNCQDTSPQALTEYLPRWFAQIPSQTACLIFCTTPPGAVAMAQALAAQDFYPVETMMEFHLALRHFNAIIRQPAQRERLRMAQPADRPRVEEIAAAAFAADRYHLDPNLPSAKADRRFRDWVGRSFAANEPIFLLEDTDSGRVLGFIQCRPITEHSMDVTLGSVDREIQRSGAGVLMYQLMFLELKRQGYREAITRVSLHNIGGVKLTLRFGFTVRSAVSTWHWFRPAQA